MPSDTVSRIVLTGAPGSGKTEFLRRLSAEPALAGFCFLEEQARRILIEQPEIRHDRSAFHKIVYQRQTAAEATAGERPFITDRGTVDAYAFHPDHLAEVGATLQREYARYTLVIHLGTAATLGSEFFVTDTVRHESAEEALEIERAHRAAWSGHPAYVYIPANPCIDAKYKQCRRLVLESAGRP